MKEVLLFPLRLLMALGVLLTMFYCAGILYFFVPPYVPFVPMAVALAYPVIWFLLFLFFKRFFYVFLAYGLISGGIIGAFSLVPPSHDRNWLPEYERVPYAVYSQDRSEMTVIDIRDFDYVTLDDFKTEYQSITYDLDTLEGVDLVLSHWDDQVSIAHTLLVFRFTDAENLVVSAETRREKGEPWDIPRGLFNQYELIHVLGTERDLLRRRTNIKNEDVFLYPTTLDKEKSRLLLDGVLDRINKIHAQPVFYNTLTKNCTSSLFEVSAHPSLRDALRPEFLLNGFSDRFAYRKGVIGKGYSTYWDMKINHYISSKAKALDDDTDYSVVIRE